MPTESRKLRLAVLISGSGTNLQALIDRAAEGSLAADLAVVVSDRPGAYGLTRAARANIPAHSVDYGSYLKMDLTRMQGDLPVRVEDLDRKQRILQHLDPAPRLERLSQMIMAEQELIGIIDSYHPDLICLAGFMRLVTPYFIEHFNRDGQFRIINVHPALLPAFPGRRGYEDTFEYGCKWGGITIHFVDEGEDSGPIIAQAVYPVWPADGIETVRARGLGLEYEMYAQVINWAAAGRIHIATSPSGRFLASITDPAYPAVLESWVRQAFSAG